MTSFSNEARGSLFAVLSGLCYGLVGYLGITLINSGLSIATMCFFRFALAAIFCFAFTFTQHQYISLNLRSFTKVLLASAAFFGGDALLYFKASTYIGTGLAVIIFFTYPVFVVLIERTLYGKKISTIFQIALAIIMVGMCLLIDTHEIAFDITGISLGIACAIFYACYIIACKKTSLPPLISTLAITTGCALMCLNVALLEGSFTLPTLNFPIAVSFFAISIICTILPTLLLVKSLKYISTEKASILAVFEPIFIMLLGVTLLGEQITNIQMVGATIILFGALMTLVNEERIILPFMQIREHLFNIPIPEKYRIVEV